MPQSRPNKPVVFHVNRTRISDRSVGNDISPLGKKLMKIAHEIEHADGPALSEVEIEHELEKRRGGYTGNGR